MAAFEDCDYLSEVDLDTKECVSVALATNGIKTLHVLFLLSHNFKTKSLETLTRFEITYVNPPERRLYTFESLEAAREKYNEL